MISYMKGQAALDEIIEADGCTCLSSVKLPEEERVHRGAEVVAEGGESGLQLLVVDAARLVSVGKSYLSDT